ncbi:MAG: hypothetical protein MZV70_75565 [Desulfobacterales bacterium]|nr:hypothetical protein [Desulfobacterales bacterium]
MGAQGVFEEFLQTGVSDVPEPEPQDERVLNAYFPSRTEDEKRISDLQSYINNLAELFPGLEEADLRDRGHHRPAVGRGLEALLQAPADQQEHHRETLLGALFRRRA